MKFINTKEQTECSLRMSNAHEKIKENRQGNVLFKKFRYFFYSVKSEFYRSVLYFCSGQNLGYELHTYLMGL